MAKPILNLRVSLDKNISRDIAISSESSLYKLAEVINQIFGFDFDHAFGFYDNIKDIYKANTVYELFKDLGNPSVDHAKSVKRSKVGQAFDRDGKVFTFLFDYGDEWIFKVERLSQEDGAAPAAFWKLLKSTGDAPPQYPDYEEEEDDVRPFNEKFELIKIGELTVAKRRPKS